MRNKYLTKFIIGYNFITLFNYCAGYCIECFDCFINELLYKNQYSVFCSAGFHPMYN